MIKISRQEENSGHPLPFIFKDTGVLTSPNCAQSII